MEKSGEGPGVGRATAQGGRSYRGGRGGVPPRPTAADTFPPVRHLNKAQDFRNLHPSQPWAPRIMPRTGLERRREGGGRDKKSTPSGKHGRTGRHAGHVWCAVVDRTCVQCTSRCKSLTSEYPNWVKNQLKVRFYACCSDLRTLARAGRREGAGVGYEGLRGAWGRGGGGWRERAPWVCSVVHGVMAASFHFSTYLRRAPRSLAAPFHARSAAARAPPAAAALSSRPPNPSSSLAPDTIPPCTSVCLSRALCAFCSLSESPVRPSPLCPSCLPASLVSPHVPLHAPTARPRLQPRIMPVLTARPRLPQHLP